MANLYYDVRVDIQKDNVIDSGIRLTQGDSKVIYLRIAVMNGGVKFDASNTTPSINFVKPDGTYVVGTPVAAGDFWIYQILGNELQRAGKVLCDVKFTYESGRVSSSKFTFIVEKDTTISGAAASSSYVTPMEELLAEMQNYKNLGMDYAEYAKSYTEGGTGKREGEDTDNSKYYYEQVQSASETIIPKAEETEENARIAAAASESASESAVNALTSENNAKLSETNSKASEDNAAASELNAKASEESAKESADKAEREAQKIVSVYKFKGSVNTYDELPTEDLSVGDVWDVIETDINYAWTGDDWDALGTSTNIATRENTGVVKIGNGINIEPDGTISVTEVDVSATSTSTTDLDNSADGNIRSLHMLGNGRKSRNLFDASTISAMNYIYENGVFINKSTDTRTYFQFMVSVENDSNKVIARIFTDIVSKGVYYRTLNLSDIDKTEISRLRIKHNGSSQDLAVLIPFKTNADYITVSLNVLGTDATTIGGLSFTDVMVYEGSEKLPYEPYGQLILSDGVVESKNADNTKISTINASEILNTDFIGVNDIHDELIVNADGSGKFIKRVGKVDLGEFTYSKSESAASVFIAKQVPFNTIMNNLLTALYTTIDYRTTIAQMPDKTIKGYYASGRFYIADTSYADATAEEYKTAVSGVMLYYELDTPTETDLTPQQVSALLSLKTFRDKTLITSDCEYEIGYFADSNIGQSLADINALMWNLLKGQEEPTTEPLAEETEE